MFFILATFFKNDLYVLKTPKPALGLETCKTLPKVCDDLNKDCELMHAGINTFRFGYL